MLDPDGEEAGLKAKLYWRQVLRQYLDSLVVERGLSQATAEAYGQALEYLGRTLDRPIGGRGINPLDATPAAIRDHLRELRERGVGPRTITKSIAAYRSFFAYLVEVGIRETNPTTNLTNPKYGPALPRVLSREQIDRLLAAPDVATPLGLRDRAMIELLYATGLRVSELVGLTLGRLRLEQGFLLTRGKGSKERLVPVGDEAREWVSRYLKEIRPRVAGRHEVVFCNGDGEPMSRRGFYKVLVGHGNRVGVKLSPHVLRHSFATHMMENGADVLSIKAMLGHAKIEHTQIYTHVSQERLRESYDRHHPRA